VCEEDFRLMVWKPDPNSYQEGWLSNTPSSQIPVGSAAWQAKYAREQDEARQKADQARQAEAARTRAAQDEAARRQAQQAQGARQLSEHVATPRQQVRQAVSTQEARAAAVSFAFINPSVSGPKRGRLSYFIVLLLLVFFAVCAWVIIENNSNQSLVTSTPVNEEQPTRSSNADGSVTSRQIEVQPPTIPRFSRSAPAAAPATAAPDQQYAASGPQPNTVQTESTAPVASTYLGCDVPVAPLAIDGASATEQQMEAAHDAVKMFIRNSDRYQDCLGRVGDDQFSKNQEVQSAISANQADKQQVGDAYNAAVEVFKAREAQQ
jgi:hypothetical protein